MPKFSFDSDTDMTALLKAKMPLAFDEVKADFSALGKSERGNIHIGEVAHKTSITVDIDGTKAAAVTKVEMTDKMSIMPQKEVVLNRPFVFMIIDNTTKLPIFIGNLMSVK
jgi:serpin B